jgi:hypothetical protein
LLALLAAIFAALAVAGLAIARRRDLNHRP